LHFTGVSKIPLGFDRENFHPDPGARNRIRAELGCDSPLIAYFGRVTPEKGIHVLVRAAAHLKTQHWRLLFDNFENKRSEYASGVLAQIEELGSTSRVLWCSPTHSEVGAFMNAADVVVVPSISTPRWREQYGRVAQEAMACGTLVIASRSGALPELVGDGALLFDEGDEKALATLLAEVVSHPARFDQVRAKGIARARGSLTVGRQAELMSEAFKDLLARRAVSPA